MARKRSADSDSDEIILHRPTKLKRSSHTRDDCSERRTADQTHTGNLMPTTSPSIHRERNKASINPHPRMSKKKTLKRGLESDDEATTPKHKRRQQATLPSPEETPSRVTMKLLDKLQLCTSSAPKLFHGLAYHTPPASPPALQDEFLDVLPGELVDLVSLYTAVVNATSAQLAANVSALRVDSKRLLETATTAWRKRRITLEDLRRIMPLAQMSGFDFELQDFGRAGIFMVNTEAGQGASHPSIPDTSRLCKNFEAVLRARWQQYSRENGNSTEFVNSLPICPLPVNESVVKAAPILSRGRERLASIKSCQAAAVETRHSAAPLQASKPSTLHSRGTSLLDRILTKQALMAALPAAPTQEELLRRSALCRVEEVARVLEILAAGKARASFSMLSIVQHLQQSLRNPISKAEVAECLSVMADEIMPSFVALVSTGTVSGVVVVTRNGKVGIADLKKRLADAGI